MADASLPGRFSKSGAFFSRAAGAVAVRTSVQHKLTTEVASDTASTPPQVHRIEITTRTMLKLLVVLVTCWFVGRIAAVLLMIVAALMLVGSLNPTVERLESRGWGRGTAIAVIFAVLFVIVLLMLTVTLPELLAQGTSLLEREPVMREQVATWLSHRRMTAPLAASLRTVNYGALLGNSTQFALNASLQAVEIIAYSVGAVFLALYVMLDRDRLRGALFAIVPRAHHIALSRVLLNLERIVGGYIRGQVITCALMGVFVFALLAIAGVKSALAIAVFAGIADVLPYIGGLLIFGPAVLAALTVSAVTATVVGGAGRTAGRWSVGWNGGRHAGTAGCRRNADAGGGAARRPSRPIADTGERATARSGRHYRSGIHGADAGYAGTRGGGSCSRDRG